ncbi:MAG: hypothetical protein N2578_07505, partial [Bdellovibrionaceae bacterium]|nr:hypothetical protein [Pseudobdellovibrionaceae bacterium]
SGRHLEAILSGGSHCSLPVSYRWSVVTDIMQGLFARHAHLTQTEEFRIAVPVEPAARAEGLQAFAQSEFVTLRFAQGVQTELNVPWSSIGFPRPEEITPEIQALVQRWAQHNITWSQVETNEGPAVVLVWEYVPL